MITYVAFIRGINVGGNNIVKMERLRELCNILGWLSVQTYIQSGNIIFQSEIVDKDKVIAAIEKTLLEELGKEIKAIVFNLAEMREIVAHFPPIFDDPTWKHNVIFLRPSLDSKEVLFRFPIKNDIETSSYFPGVLYWSAKQMEITRSIMIKLSTRKEYQEMTVRNINTTRKILELMLKLDASA